MNPSKEPTFDAPIPGQSLTGELGSKPWEKPPKLNTVNEVIENYMPAFEDKAMVTEILNQMESGIPIIPIVNLLIRAGVMDGDHTLDTGLLAAPVLIEMLINVAEASDVKYKIGNETKKNVEPSMSAIALALRDFDDVEEETTLEEEVMEASPMEPPREPSMGLMTKRGEEDGI